MTEAATKAGLQVLQNMTLQEKQPSAEQTLKQEGAKADGGKKASSKLNNGAGEGKVNGVKLVVQRCNSASLVLDERAERGSIGRGLVVFLSIGADTTDSMLAKAARATLTLPLSTIGEWGDDNKARSIMSIVMEDDEQGSERAQKDFKTKPGQGLIIVPQACLTSTIKGTRLRYSQQLNRDEGLEKYCAFLELLQRNVLEVFLEHLFKSQTALKAFEKILDENFITWCQEGRGLKRFSKFDKRGVPTHWNSDDGVNDKQLSKSERKTAEKAYKQVVAFIAETCQERIECWRRYQTRHSVSVTVDDDSVCPVSEEATSPQGKLPAIFPIVAGTFGFRQGLELNSLLGPSTHILEFDGR